MENNKQHLLSVCFKSISDLIHNTNILLGDVQRRDTYDSPDRPHDLKLIEVNLRAIEVYTQVFNAGTYSAQIRQGKT